MRKVMLPYGVVTAQGNWQVQEDGYWIDPSSGCFLLADGFGGKGAGDLAVKEVLEQFEKGNKKDFGVDTVKSILELAHRESQQKFPKAGCSVGGFWIKGKWALVIGCGAVSSFLYREGKFETIIGVNGVLSQDMSIVLPLQAVGLGQLDFEYRWLELKENDILMVNSGGIHSKNEIFLESLQKNLSLLPMGESLQSALELVISPLQPSVGNQSLMAVQYFDSQSLPNF